MRGQTDIGERLAGQPARPAAVGRPWTAVCFLAGTAGQKRCLAWLNFRGVGAGRGGGGDRLSKQRGALLSVLPPIHLHKSLTSLPPFAMHLLSLVFLSHAHCRNPYSTNCAILLKRPRSIDYISASQPFLCRNFFLSILEDGDISLQLCFLNFIKLFLLNKKIFFFFNFFPK